MTETAPRRTEYIPLDHLQADPANPKAHDTAAIDASIGRFGVIDQIVRDDRTGYIISGHGRDESLRRMRDRGDNPPEGIRLDASGNWLVPVIVGWSSRTDSEARAALIALNRTTELGGWVDDALLDLLDGLDDYTGVGFTEDDTDDLRARLEELSTSDVAESTPEFEENTKKTPTLKEYATTYAEQGRRLIVLDYTVEEYPQVTARLKALRAAKEVDNNAQAVALLLSEVLPDVQPEESATGIDDALRSLGLDDSDPAATLDKEPS